MKTTLLRRTAGAALGLAAFGLAMALPAAEPPKTPEAEPSLKSLKMPDSTPVEDPALVLRILREARELDPTWKPNVRKEKLRDKAATTVYTAAASAVVALRTPGGYGTGFLIDPSGWIITNNHVVEAAQMNPATGVRQVAVFLGRIGPDHFMVLNKSRLTAQVYRQNAAKDLALLKLTALPVGVKSLPALAIAKEAPLPGSACYSIGHPSSAALWTLRFGSVAAVSTWPGEKTQMVMAELGLASKQMDAFEAAVKKMPRVKVLVSDFGIFLGNSGGPLLNEKGEVVAVTFARHSQDASVGFHIHKDELLAFAAEKPDKPVVRMEVPDPWPAAVASAVQDLDGDGVPDTMAFRARVGQPATAILLDLEQGSAKKYTYAELGRTRPIRKWDFQFGLHASPVRRTFYATGKDGKVDLILTDLNNDGVADEVLRRTGNKWKWEEPKGRKMIDPSLFADKVMQQRLGVV